MNFNWLKRYMPSGLYARAALILLLPVITVQLVVTVVFIQRHFEGVTRQMTSSLALDLGLVLEEINTATTLIEATARIARLTDPLKFDIELPAPAAPRAEARKFYDLSGRVVISTLHELLAEVSSVDLVSDRRTVMLGLETRHGIARVSFGRNRVSASNPHQILVMMVFVGTFMTIIAFLYLRNQLRPIKLLASAAESFGKGRIVEYRPAGAIEVRAAGNAFLDMRARIERQIEQRTLMLSGISHDLRTPLTRFKLGLSMLDADAEISDLKRDIADMEQLLDAFLAFARDDALDDPQDCDPVALVRETVAKARRSGGNISLEETTGSGRATLRPLAVERALDNLIGNALRYGTRAMVQLTLTERSVKISVHDDGPGIAPEQRDEALRPFTRLDRSRNQDRGSGVGLGLAISQDIARKHGGSLHLRESMLLGGLRADLIFPR